MLLIILKCEERDVFMEDKVKKKKKKEKGMWYLMT